VQVYRRIANVHLKHLSTARRRMSAVTPSTELPFATDYAKVRGTCTSILFSILILLLLSSASATATSVTAEKPASVADRSETDTGVARESFFQGSNVGVVRGVGKGGQGDMSPRKFPC